MQIAAYNVGRLSRVVAGAAGVAVAALGALPLFMTTVEVRPEAALLPAGIALLLGALPGSAPAVRFPAYVLAGLAAVLGAITLPGHLAAGLATLLAGLGLTLIDLRLPGSRPGGTAGFRVADPLLAGAAIIALLALIPRMFAPAFPDGGSVGMMSPYLAGGLLTLALGATLARRAADPLHTAAAADPGATIRTDDRAEVALGEHTVQLMAGNDRLREANARLESALAFKNDLTSMLAHDMAQPISSIASLAELLSDDWADLGDDIRQDLASKINKNTRRLIKMMNDLLLLFMLDTGSVTARRTPVAVREVVESVAASAPEGTVRIEVADGVSALADRGHLTAVVQNLLSNALAYAEAPVHIQARREADSVVLVVQDSGAGIPEELVPTLFDRFMRGAGLGLFIVRHLVEANGGSVRYERAEPHGARLIVTLESASVPG